MLAVLTLQTSFRSGPVPNASRCGPRTRNSELGTRLHVEQDIDHVAILDDVLLALSPQQSVLLRLRFGAARHQVFELDDFRADKAALQVAMDLARGFRCA